MMMIAACFIAYASFWAALRLAGIQRIKSAAYAGLPAVLAGMMNITFLQSIQLQTAILFAVIMTGFLVVVSGRKWLPSLIAALLGLSLCMYGQLLIAVFEISGWRLVIPGIVLYLVSLPLWNKNICIFREDFALTREQRKSIRGLMFSLFPGPVVGFFWSAFILWDKELWVLPIVVFNMLFLLLVVWMLNRLTAEMQAHLESMMDKKYQNELMGFMRLIRSQRHDFNFHMQTVYGLLEKKQYQACQDYINSMLAIVQSSNDVLPLSNPAISALLNTFQELALQKGLKLEVEIHDNLGQIPCSVYEINTILGNLIQNAIDELENHTEERRLIQLLIIKRGRNNVIKVSNDCHLSAQDMTEIFTPGFTTKPSHEGLGLANAARIAEKYGGVVFPEFEGKTLHMIARIPMRG